MKKTIYTFNNGNTNSSNFFPSNGTNYSKILNDLIIADLKKKNSYLNTCCTGTIDDDFIDCMIKDSAKKHPGIIIKGCALKDDNKFIEAANFLANYKKKKDILSKFTIGKLYKLSDGTPIIFYDDEIQIGFDLYTYDDFKNITFLKALPTTTKTAIINIINISISL